MTSAGDILAVIAENESLRTALDQERKDKARWFDIALSRLGHIQSLAFEVSALKNSALKAGETT